MSQTKLGGLFSIGVQRRMVYSCGLKTTTFITIVGFTMMLVAIRLLVDKPYSPPLKEPSAIYYTFTSVNQTRSVEVITRGSCVEKTRIAFIKVHKAASTTITSIVQRYGLNHHLTFALPKVDLYHIGFFETFDPVNVKPIPEGTVYEALCQHVVYNREAFRKYLPSDIAVVAAVREPFQRFVSAFQFFYEYAESMRIKAHMSGDSVKLMREFLRNPNYYEPQRFKAGSLAFNRMGFDLGLPKEQYTNASFVDDYIRLLDEDLTFVVVAEYFDQSLVLLKRIMCWTTKDILYQVRHKGPRKPSLPEDLKLTHRKLAPSEYQIYNFFERKFHKLYSKEVGIDEEVKLYRETLNHVKKFCNSGKKIIVIEPNKFDSGFTFTSADCHFLNMEETTFVRHLAKVQRPRPDIKHS